MTSPPNEPTSPTRVIRLGGREIITEGLRLKFWADLSHRCMTASWPAFIAGAALVSSTRRARFTGWAPTTSRQ
jgi:inward rectifier potassium channel